MENLWAWSAAGALTVAVIWIVVSACRRPKPSHIRPWGPRPPGWRPGDSIPVSIDRLQTNGGPVEVLLDADLDSTPAYRAADEVPPPVPIVVPEPGPGVGAAQVLFGACGYGTDKWAVITTQTPTEPLPTAAAENPKRKRAAKKPTAKKKTALKRKSQK